MQIFFYDSDVGAGVRRITTRAILRTGQTRLSLLVGAGGAVAVIVLHVVAAVNGVRDGAAMPLFQPPTTVVVM